MADVEEMVARHPQTREPKIPLPRTLNNLPVVEAFAPPAERDRMTEMDAQLTALVRKTNKEDKQVPLQKLASLLTTLNFGDMMEFSSGTSGEAQKVWDWAIAYLAKDMKDDKVQSSTNS
jgi:hypothetical protein